MEANGEMGLLADWEPRVIFVKILQRIGRTKHLLLAAANHAMVEGLYVELVIGVAMVGTLIGLFPNANN